MATKPVLLSTASGAAVNAALDAPKKEEDDPFAAAFAQLVAEDAGTPAPAPGKTDASGGGTVRPQTDVSAPGQVAREAQEGEAAREAQAAAATIAAKAAADAAAMATDLPEDDAAKAAAAEAAKVATAAEAAKVAATKEATSVTPADDEIVRRLAALLKAAPEQTQTTDPADEPFQPTIPDGANEVIAQYAKDFPDVMKAEGLIRQIEYQGIVAYVFKNITQFLQPHLDTLHEIAARTHLGDIQTAVPDYAAVREEVVKWVDKQPDYLQPAFKQVMVNGNKDQVVDLIRRARAETAQTPEVLAAAEAARVAAASAQAAATGAVTTAAAKLAAAKAALAPVGSKRTNLPVHNDPTDFESAFMQFASEA